MDDIMTGLLKGIHVMCVRNNNEAIIGKKKDYSNRGKKSHLIIHEKQR